MDNSTSNNIWNSIMLSAEEIDIYRFDEDANDRLLDQHPWTSEGRYFTKVRISAVSLIKMVMHSISGGNIEVMGLMRGKVIGNEFIILDAFGLPVEGTETRVNAGSEAHTYMVDHLIMEERVGKTEGICGWYHSHPGYGVWLSGIDIETQKLHQKVEEPYLSIVIDPIRTISSGKVVIGCFRSFPDNYRPPDAEESEYQNIPLNKMEDFGFHYQRYYTLEHTIFKSSMDTHILDLLWNRYWTQTLSSSTLLINKDYTNSAIEDLSKKLERFERQDRGERRPWSWSSHGGEKHQLSNIAQDAAKIGSQQGQWLINMLLRNLLFYQPNVKE